jgi:hypothetical protein
VLMVVILLLRVLSCLDSLSSMGMVVRVLELLLRVMRVVLLHRRVITLLLLVLRESLLVVRGEIFESDSLSFVFPCKLHSDGVFVISLKTERDGFAFWFFAIPTYLYDEEGTGCWFILSFLVSLLVFNHPVFGFDAGLLLLRHGLMSLLPFG